MSTITATPIEYLEAIPRTIGYVPHDSLLVINMPTADAPGRRDSISVMRLDLPTAAEDVQQIRTALENTFLRLGHAGFTGWQDVMLAVWDERGARTQHTTEVLRWIVQSTRQRTPFRISALLTVTAEAVHGLIRTRDGEPHHVLQPRSTSPSILEAELVLRGRQTLPDREAVEATVGPAAHALGFPAGQVDLPALEQAWCAAGTGRIAGDQIAALVTGLTNTTYLDRALASLMRAAERGGLTPLGGTVLDKAQTGQLLDNLRHACRSYTDAPELADLLAVTSYTAWTLGDGTTAAIAQQRAERLHPRHRLTRLLGVALAQGIRPPSPWTD